MDPGLEPARVHSVLAFVALQACAWRMRVRAASGFFACSVLPAWHCNATIVAVLYSALYEWTITTVTVLLLAASSKVYILRVVC